MAITALPTPPLRSDPTNFAERADTFLAALPTFATEANALAAAMNLNSTTDASTSSVTIGTGSKSFVVSNGKSFQPGMYLVIADTAAPSTNSMWGQITSYSGTSLVVSIIAVRGAGTKASWVISQSSPGGAQLGANSDITSLSAVSSINGGQLSGFRNRIINGDMRIDQRTAGAVYTLGVSENYGGPDRFVVSWDGTLGTGTVQQLGFANGTGMFPNNTHFYRWNQTSGGSGNTAKILQQRIESVETFQGTTVTFSFWARAGASLTITPDLVQVFGSGGSPSLPVTTAGLGLNITTSWARYSVTIAVPSIIGKLKGSNGSDSLWVRLNLPANTAFAFDTTGWQLETGSVATAFEQRPLSLERQLCKNYYRVYATAQNVNDLAYDMRATPTQAGVGPYTYSAEL